MKAICLGLIALAAAACSPAYKATFDDVNVVRPGIPVPGAGASAIASVTFPFSFDSGQLGATQNLQAQSTVAAVQLNRLSLTATSGIADLSFIRTFRATAFVPLKTSNNDTQCDRQVEIAEYERQSDAAVGRTFVVPLPDSVDLLPLIEPRSTEKRKIVVVVNLSGELPRQAWVVDVAMGISVELRE